MAATVDSRNTKIIHSSTPFALTGQLVWLTGHGNVHYLGGGGMCSHITCTRELDV
jgi:hypothetical protein